MFSLASLIRILISLTIIIVLTACGGGGSSVPVGAKVNELKPIFTYDESILIKPKFDVSIKSDSQTVITGTPVTYSVLIEKNNFQIKSVTWLFDDDTQMTGTNISRSFLGTGYQTIVVDVEDNQSNIVRAKKVINIVTSTITTVPNFMGLVIGDINKDGLINSDDLLLVQNHVSSISLLSTAEEIFSADLNNDALIDQTDITLFEEIILQGWPTYVSTDAVFPGENITILLPQLLDSSNSIKISLSNQQKVTNLSRPAPGYMVFSAPFQSTFLNGQGMQNEVVKVDVTLNNLVIKTFDLTIKAFKVSNIQPGSLMKSQLNKFNNTVSLLVNNFKNITNSQVITNLQKSEINDHLNFTLDEAVIATQNFSSLFSALDKETLKVIESLLIVQNKIDVSAITPTSSAVLVSNQLPISPVKIDKQTIGVCSIPTSLTAFKLLTETSELNTAVLKPVAETLADTCNVLGASSSFYPPIAFVAAKCFIASAATSRVVDSLDIMQSILPTLNPDLQINASLNQITPNLIALPNNNETQISITATAENTDICKFGVTTAVNYKVKSLANKIITRLFRNFKLNHMITVALKQESITTGSGKWVIDAVWNTLNSLESFASGKLVSAVSTAIGAVGDTVCSIVGRTPTIKFDIPTCDLSIHQISGQSGNKSLFDEATSIYKSALLSNCRQGNVTFSGEWSFASDIITSGNVVFEQSCLPQRIQYASITATLTAQSWGTFNWAKYDTISGSTEIASMACRVNDYDLSNLKYGITPPLVPLRAIGDTETWSELWTFDYTDCDSKGDCKTTIQSADGMLSGYFFNPQTFNVAITEDRTEILPPGQYVSFFNDFKFTASGSINKLTAEFNGTEVDITKLYWNLNGSTSICRDDANLKGLPQFLMAQ